MLSEGGSQCADALSHISVTLQVYVLFIYRWSHFINKFSQVKSSLSPEMISSNNNYYDNMD